MKKLVLFLSCFLIFFLLVSPIEGHAKSNAVTLSTKDLTFWDIKPNESVTKAMNKITKRYPKLEFSQSAGNYYTGDPTENMNYFLEFYPDSKDRIIGVQYEQFNVEKSGLKFTTSKGIKIGSTMLEVRKKYGKNYTETTSSDQGYEYVQFTYPIILKETKQQGKLTIKMEYPVGAKKYTALVYGVEYILEPLQEKRTSDETDFTSLFGGKALGTFNGKTIKAGMTKKEVLNLIGDPLEIREPMGGTQVDRALLKKAFGTDMFNLLDHEQWSYMRMLDYGKYEVTVIYFNHQDLVSEVLVLQ